MPTVARYLIENVGAEPSGIELLIASASQLCQQLSCSDVTLVVPVKNMFRSSVVAKVIGDGPANELYKGRVISLGNGAKMKISLPRDIRPYGDYGVVIAPHLTNQDMDVVDSIIAAKAIVFLPFNREDGVRWLSTWNPKVIGPSTWSGSQASLPQPILAELQRLTRLVNLQTGLTHPSDKAEAKRTLSELNGQHGVVDPELVRQWAVNNGWAPRHAEELKKLAQKCLRCD